MKLSQALNKNKRLTQNVPVISMAGSGLADGSSPIDAVWDVSSTDIPDIMKTVPINTVSKDNQKRVIKRWFPKDIV